MDAQSRRGLWTRDLLGDSSQVAKGCGSCAGTRLNGERAVPLAHDWRWNFPQCCSVLLQMLNEAASDGPLRRVMRCCGVHRHQSTWYMRCSCRSALQGCSSGHSKHGNPGYYWIWDQHSFTYPYQRWRCVFFKKGKNHGAPYFVIQASW